MDEGKVPRMIISPEYAEMNRQMHEQIPQYGAGGHRYAPVILQAVRTYKATSVLDFGCGKGTLAPVLRANGLDVREFDPAIRGKDTFPEPADLVYCGDVAEHVEPELLLAFLDSLRQVTRHALILVVATRPSWKKLPDGRSAHLIVEPVEWWLPKLRERFWMASLTAGHGEFVFVGEAHEHHTEN
jgi:SAM-dependent methyltransferase